MVVLRFLGGNLANSRFVVDDYFYPYKVTNLDFPDSATYAKYGQGFENIEDWRRNNVDQLIKNISDSLRQVKPFVKFGINPFGVWRNQDKRSWWLCNPCRTNML